MIRPALRQNERSRELAMRSGNNRSTMARLIVIGALGSIASCGNNFRNDQKKSEVTAFYDSDVHAHVVADNSASEDVLYDRIRLNSSSGEWGLYLPRLADSVVTNSPRDRFISRVIGPLGVDYQCAGYVIFHEFDIVEVRVRVRWDSGSPIGTMDGIDGFYQLCSERNR